jgi:hypothetical protein
MRPISTEKPIAAENRAQFQAAIQDIRTPVYTNEPNFKSPQNPAKPNNIKQLLIFMHDQKIGFVWVRFLASAPERPCRAVAQPATNDLPFFQTN